MTDNVTKTYPILEARRRETVSAMFFDGTPECADAILDWIFASHEKMSAALGETNKRGKFIPEGITFTSSLGGPLDSAPPDHWVIRANSARFVFMAYSKTTFDNYLELITPGAAQ